MLTGCWRMVSLWTMTKRFPSAAENIHRPAEDILNFPFRNCNRPARGRNCSNQGDFIYEKIFHACYGGIYFHSSFFTAYPCFEMCIRDSHIPAKGQRGYRLEPPEADSGQRCLNENGLMRPDGRDWRHLIRKNLAGLNFYYFSPASF